MVNLNDIFTALKKVLDDDTALKSLLKVAGKGSKVFIGNEMPRYIAPSIQIPLMSDNMNNVTEESEITYYINIYSHCKNDKSVDVDEISGIANRLMVLIHNQSLAVSGHRIFSMYMEGQNPTIKDRENPENFIGGIRCRMFAINLS